MAAPLSALLSVRDLEVSFRTPTGILRAVNRVSFEIQPGECLGIVGESGCGKSVTALSILQLIRPSALNSISGKISWAGTELLTSSRETLERVRGAEIGMIFQEPMTALNPVFSVRDQISETIRTHFPDRSSHQIENETRYLLSLVGLDDADRVLTAYPHELSGGMRQRVVIAMALACRPKLVIADEPTTALDVTIQAQILQLLKKLQRELSLSILLISHDFGVIAEMASRIAVFYAGNIIEEGKTDTLLASPLHPYTQALLHCTPRLHAAHTQYELPVIQGSPLGAPQNVSCAFAPRCPWVIDRCHQEEPKLEPFGPSQRASCFEIKNHGTH